MSYALGYTTKPVSRPATNVRFLRPGPTTVRATPARSKSSGFYEKPGTFVQQKTGVASQPKRHVRRVRGVVSGFGQAEEIAESVIESPTASGGRSPWPTVIAVGAVGFIGLGLLYGMARTSGPGAVGWGGI